MIKLWNEGVRDYRIFRYLIVFIPLNNIIKELKKNAIYISIYIEFTQSTKEKFYTVSEVRSEAK